MCNSLSCFLNITDCSWRIQVVVSRALGMFYSSILCSTAFKLAARRAMHSCLEYHVQFPRFSYDSMCNTLHDLCAARSRFGYKSPVVSGFVATLLCPALEPLISSLEESSCLPLVSRLGRIRSRPGSASLFSSGPLFQSER